MNPAAARRTAFARLAGALAFLTLGACAGGASKPALPPVTPIMIPPSMAATPQQDLTGVAWHWLGPDGGPLPPRDLYTLELTADGRALVRAECNRGGGRYTRDGERLALTPIATTKMGCPAGSLDTVFLRQLGEVERYRFEGDALLLERRGGGAMRFAR